MTVEKQGFKKMTRSGITLQVDQRLALNLQLEVGATAESIEVTGEAPLANNSAFPGDLNVNPTVDAVEEFRVQSNTMSAEFGFTAGGVVNIVTKSGTNQFHGALSYFMRNDAFDARRAFN